MYFNVYSRYPHFLYNNYFYTWILYNTLSSGLSVLCWSDRKRELKWKQERKFKFFQDGITETRFTIPLEMIRKKIKRAKYVETGLQALYIRQQRTVIQRNGKKGKPYHCHRWMLLCFRNDSLRRLRRLKFSGFCRVTWRFAEGLQLQIFRLLSCKALSSLALCPENFSHCLNHKYHKKIDSCTKHATKSKKVIFLKTSINVLFLDLMLVTQVCSVKIHSAVSFWYEYFCMCISFQ